MVTLIIFILILGIIILVHEFGHFVFAKMFGVYVYEFSLGMGPKILSKKGKNGETEYCLRAIPIGGFVQLAGEEVDDDKRISKDRKIYSKPVWQRFLIMFFGAGNNFLLALVLLFAYALIFGAPIMSPTISGVTDNMPAQNIGLESGDKFISINGHKTSTIDDVQIYLTLYNDGNEVLFAIEKQNGNIVNYKITPEKQTIDGVETYKYGLEFSQGIEKGIIPSIKYTFTKFGALIKQMCIVVKSLFTGVLSLKNLSGPVGIYGVVGETRQAGLSSVIQLIALLSVNVGFINLIPFPAFDGGRLLFLVIEKIKGSPVST
ncbi:MAG: M50 family metallopeptidase, partial [bacterium]|nr:M50 family metallopeptidase [bacterium]